jgi:hypothetical protein
MTKKGGKKKHVYIVEERNKDNIVARRERWKGQTLTKVGKRKKKVGM